MADYPYDFSAMTEILSQNYTDRMDIGRARTVKDPGGYEIEVDSDEPIYTDVPCYFRFNTSDAPAQSTADTPVVAVNIEIRCVPDIDIRNSDYVTIRRMGADGVMQKYEGLVGFRSMHRTYLSVLMGMKQA